MAYNIEYSLVRLRDDRQLIAPQNRADFIYKFTGFLYEVCKRLDSKTAYKLRYAYNARSIEGIESLASQYMGMKVVCNKYHNHIKLD